MIRFSKKHFASVIIAFFIAIAVNGQSIPETLITETTKAFAPDKRVAILEIAYEKGVVKGQTNLPEAKKNLLDKFSKNSISFVDSIRVLPDEIVGISSVALVNVSVANIRSQPAESAELASQALLGMPLRVFDKKGGWLRVQTPDAYIGWVSSSTVTRFTQQALDSLQSLPKIIYTKGYGFAYASPDMNTQTVSDLTWGNTLFFLSQKKAFYHVKFPDGRTGFIPKNEAQIFDSWLKQLTSTKTSLVEASKQMMGLPYLWGGTSWKGVDCSGFTRTIYLMNGMLLPRDASQQVNVGLEISTANGFDDLQHGDLLFFGRKETENSPEKVVHVGMWLGNGQFIHSSGMVQISSFNENDANFDEYNFKRFLRAKRMINQETVQKLQPKRVY